MKFYALWKGLRVLLHYFQDFMKMLCIMERVVSFVALFSGFYEVLCIVKRVASFLWIILRNCAASGIHRRPGEPLAEGSRRRENKQGEGFKLDRNTSYLNWAETKSIVDPHSDG